MAETFRMTRSMRISSTILTALLRAGMPLGSLTLLSVRGHKSGKISTIPVALVEQGNASFLVAAFGEVSWVRNLRAAGLAQFTRRRCTEVSGVVELEAREAAPILKQFLTSYHLVPFIPPYFDVTPQSTLADAEDILSSQSPRQSRTRYTDNCPACLLRNEPPDPLPESRAAHLPNLQRCEWDLMLEPRSSLRRREATRSRFLLGAQEPFCGGGTHRKQLLALLCVELNPALALQIRKEGRQKRDQAFHADVASGSPYHA